MSRLTEQPIFFEKNRVGRVYRGGKLFADFFGDDSVDGNMPEEWVASSVSAQKGNVTGSQEGVSKVLGTEIFFDQLLKEDKYNMVGDRERFDVLTKVLDSAIRLPVQAHPDKAFSKRYFGSNYGKTEMWLVLATRENAKVCFGFKAGVTREIFDTAIDASQYDRDAMPALLNQVEVKPGDVFLLPAKVVHAIGAGCLILEVQEPTDFTIEPEAWCGDYHLSEKEMFMGLDRKTAVDCFDFDISQDEVWRKGRPQSSVIGSGDGFVSESLISYEHTKCFAVNRHTLKTCHGFRLDAAPAVFVVTEGEGVIAGNQYHKQVKKGDYFFLPYAASGKFSAETKTDLQLAEIVPSKRGM